MSRDPSTGSASADRALTLLERLVEADEPLTLTELSARCGVPLATCSVIMGTFESRGYAQRHIVGRSHLWRPTLRLYELGMLTLRRVALGTESEPVLQELRDELGLPTHLGVLDGSSIVYVARARTQSMVQFNNYPGRMAPFNLTALGKAIAAFRVPSERESLIASAVPGSGPNAQHHLGAALERELHEIRSRGYAIEDQEEEAGVACVAAPVLGTDGLAAGAIGVTGFADQLLGERLPAIAHSVIWAAGSLARRTGLRRTNDRTT